MVRQESMTGKLKRRIGKVISIALSAAMLVTGLPTDLTGGGVASVNAAGVIETAGTAGSETHVPYTVTDSEYSYALEGSHGEGDENLIKPGNVGDRTWTFRVNVEGAEPEVTIQGKTGTYAGLQIDATASGAKFYVRNMQWAQFNSGAIIKIPVDGYCDITVVGYGGSQYTVAGEDGTETQTFTYKGTAGYVDVVAKNNTYIDKISVVHKEAPAEVVLDSAKPDVWDFGAMTVAGANNLLTVDVINGFYPEGTKAGSNGNDISGFEAKDSNGVVAVKFVTNKTNHRIRTTNEKITRNDEKSKLGDDGVTYEGYLYSNNTSSLDKVANSLSGESDELADHLDVYLYEGDTLTLMLGSNGSKALYKLYNPEKQEYAEFDFTNKKKVSVVEDGKTNEKTAGVETAVFHAADEGFYQLYCTNEKLVCARITRTHAPKVTVSGTIDTTDATGIVYTNTTTNFQTVMPVKNGAYTGKVSGGYDYKVTLKDANGYVVDGGRKISIGTDEEAVANDLTIKTVDQKTITGAVEGLTDAEMEKVKFVFTVPEDYIFEPELTLNRSTGTYSLQVESGVEYKVAALDVNDSELKTVNIGKVTADTVDVKITFEKKPTYKVTLKITGVDNSDNAVVTFTNIGEKYSDGKTSYSYKFGIADEIKLRDGSYSVKVTGLGNYPVAQALTMNVNVSGEAVTDAPVPFKVLSAWDFADLNDDVDIETIDGKKYYAGLLLTDSPADENGKTSSVAENKTYLLGNAGTKVTVPDLKAGDIVTITYCYTAAFELTENDAAVTNNSANWIQTASGSTDTSKFESTTYTMKADGSLTINNVVGTVALKDKAVNQTYLCSIDVAHKADQVEYSETIAVGSNKTYKTIGAALAAVRKMTRTDDQNVTIMIDPGDYEEMLVIDTPNVTLKNASATPSIALKNKGVDIDENAVRVTWYYGHGYTYYSMGSDCKYDADLLAVNKANGYASFTNPGSGTTSGSYWNATVVITADKVSADGIIFENSFNQYMSKKATEDVIEKQSGAKEGSVSRIGMNAGDTTVQNKAYVERAAALAIYNDKKEISFNNCKFIGRQDTLYGGTGVTAAFYDCSIYGGTDYIFGGMTAVFAKCDLVFNTSEDKNDVGYITAAQQKTGRGYLMYNCTVTSTKPGVDTASEYTSKPGYLGRPWQANTGEAVFYYTIVEAADEHWVSNGKSLILPIGWNSGLGGKSALSQEYKTYELAEGVDNSASRADWAKVLNDEEAKGITVASFLGDWKAFVGKDMKIVLPDGTVIDDGNSDTGDDDSDDDDNYGTNDGTDDGWDKVKDPVINDVDYVSGDGNDQMSSDGNDKLIIKVTADVSDKGGESLEVTVKKTDGTCAPEPQTTTTKGPKHTFEFKVNGPGEYEVTATLKRKGKTPKTTTRTVTIKANGKVEITGRKKGLHVELFDSGVYTYTGSAIKPAIEVYNEDELLVEGTDYTVKYTNNVKAATKDDGKKAPTITITGKGRLTGKTTKTFTIQPKSLEAKDIVVGGRTEDGKLIVGQNVKISPVIVYKGVVLKAGAKKDFVLTTNITKDKPTTANQGAPITIEGKNNYTGKLTLKLDVKEKLQKVGSVKIDKNKMKTYTYDGTKKEAPIDAVMSGKTKLKVNEEYVIVYNGDQTSAGTQKFTVVGMGLYTGSKTSSYKINPRKIKAGQGLEVDSYDSLKKVNGTITVSYNSAGVTFTDELIVKDTTLNGGTELVLGKDYKVSYSNNKKASNAAKFTVTFLGNYKGSAALKKTFTIAPLDLEKDLRETPFPDDRGDKLYMKSADKAYTKVGIYKSAPYVLVNGVALKSSDYKVTYYLDKDMKNEMKGKTKLELTGGNTSAPVFVKIEGKKNYSGVVTTSFNVISTEGKTDISKVKVTPQYASNNKKQSKVPYTGKAVYPEQIKIMQGKTELAILKPDANGEWNNATNTALGYEVTFVNNIEKGKATIIVTGIGKNVGSKTATYTVAAGNLPKDQSQKDYGEFWKDIKEFKSLLDQTGQLIVQ
ncbi:MAG: pectinesterase family protein [Butyrivibrio sp.]|nr:pectinesterase family protein [Butyrivibrio sp.]